LELNRSIPEPVRGEQVGKVDELIRSHFGPGDGFGCQQNHPYGKLCVPTLTPNGNGTPSNPSLYTTWPLTRSAPAVSINMQTIFKNRRYGKILKHILPMEK
jgi:hypothetical protein